MTHARTAPRAVATSDGRAVRTEFPCFNGYRAIAAMSVLVYHAGFAGFTSREHMLGLSFFFARLDIGVAIFFLVSAFLLYRPFVVSHFTHSPGPGIRSYWRRRLLRIVPAYWFALTVIAFAFDAAPGVRSARGFPVYYTLTQIYVPGRALGGIAQAWSLCTELSFYAFLPVYAWLLGRARRSPQRQLRAELVGIAALYCSSFIFRIGAHSLYPSHVETKFWLTSTTDLFALGMAIAVLSAWFSHRGVQPAFVRRWDFPLASWSLAALAFWAAAIPLGFGHHLFERTSLVEDVTRQTLYGLVALLLLLPGVFGPQEHGGIRRFLRNRVVQLVGLVSYGIFLWHLWAIKQLLEWMNAQVAADGWLRTAGGSIVPFPIVLGATVVLALTAATVSYVVVERPFLRLKGRRPAPHRHVTGR